MLGHNLKVKSTNSLYGDMLDTREVSEILGGRLLHHDGKNARQHADEKREEGHLRPGIIGRVRSGLHQLIDTRIEVIQETAREVEESIRNADVVLFEADLFVVGLSEPFASNRRKRSRKVRYDALKNTFPRVKEFSEKRIIK